MKDFNFTFNVRPVVRNWTKEQVETLIELMDSGIGYWCSDDSDEPLPELPLLMVVTESETVIGQQAPRTFRIDLATIARGINQILSYEVPINTASLGHIAVFVATNDFQHIDSEDMDLIVQAGLYNDIVWG